MAPALASADFADGDYPDNRHVLSAAFGFGSPCTLEKASPTGLCKGG